MAGGTNETVVQASELHEAMRRIKTTQIYTVFPQSPTRLPLTPLAAKLKPFC